LKILIISAGLRPRRTGGLPAYVEDLIDGLILRGHTIVYCDVAATDFWPFPRCVKRSGKYTNYTFYNASSFNPLLRGTYSPYKETQASRWFEKKILELIENEKPDIVHLQELLAFPPSLIQTVKKANTKIVLTTMDYYPLCPVITLYKFDNKNCTLPADQLVCHVCCEEAGLLPVWKAKDLIRKIFWGKSSGWLVLRKAFGLLPFLTQKSFKISWKIFSSPKPYIERRKRFIEYLKYSDAVLCISDAQMKIFESLSGLSLKLKRIHPSRRTFSEKVIKRSGYKTKKEPVVFVALNVGAAHKGLKLLLDEFSRVDRVNYELRIYGAKGTDTQQIKFIPSYEESDLDRIASAADFSIVPSLWEEAYGFVGVEMISRGVPTLVSSRGGMKEYVAQGVNGFIFDPENPGALEKIIKDILDSEDLRRQILSSLPSAARNYALFEEHLNELETFYRAMTGK